MTLGTLVLGLVNGSVIGLLAAGFVLVYQSNRFLNLAHAQLGAVSALLLAKLVNDQGWSFWAAMAVCLPLGVGVGLLVERCLVRPVRNRTSSPVRLLLLTVGIAQLLLALTFVPALSPRTDAGKPFPQPFDSDLEVGGVVLTGMSVVTLLLVPLLLVGLTSFLQFSSFGKQIRAAASNPQAARLYGISTSRVSLVTWGVAGGLSAVCAVLSGPNAPPGGGLAALGPTLLLQTLGAAAFGAFVSIPWAIGGGLALGVVYQIVLSERLDAGEAQLAIFLVILLVVLVRGSAISRVFASAGSPVPERPAVRVPLALRGSVLYSSATTWLGVAALALALVLPGLPGLSSNSSHFLLVQLLLFAMTGIALTMLIGWAGQVSLGHFAIVGLGAFLTARKVEDGWTVLGLVLGIGLACAAVTVVVGLPALRVRGLTLVVTTVGLAVLAPQWLFLQRPIGGETPFTTPVSAPALGLGLGRVDSQLKLYYVVLLALALVVVGSSSLRRSTAGRTILAVRDNERASSSLGITSATVKLSVLAVSGFVAGVVGVFWAIAWQRVTPVQFGPEMSTAILAVPVIGGLGSLPGALAGAAALYVPTLFVAPHLTPLLGEFGRNPGFLLALAGLGVVGVMLQFPNGIAGVVQGRWQQHLDRKAVDLEERQAAPDAELPLVVADVALAFGGVKALDGASIVVRPGEVVGLIGANGAGKTTLMNVVSGLLTPVAGSVRIFGAEVVNLPCDTRASFGLARSFQDASLFSGLTVRETVQLAAARGTKTGVLGALFSAPWVRENDRTTFVEADRVLESFGLTPWAHSLTSELSTGMRRITDLATQVAARPKLLLLDEPTAGVAQREAEAFGPLIRRIRDELDCSVLLIEHDMPLLMQLCDRIYAMEAGRVIAEGTPAQIREDPRVISSYLGSDATAIDRSDAVGKGTAPPPPRQRRRPAQEQVVATDRVLADGRPVQAGARPSPTRSGSVRTTPSRSDQPASARPPATASGRTPKRPRPAADRGRARPGTEED